MPLAGRALLALWNDIRPGREIEYDRWHTREHVPERVAVRGILGARRYVNRARDLHRYFTLYELEGLDALDGAEYRDVVDHPTPWSASMRSDFANFLRAPCVVTSSEGDGIGAAIVVLCFRHRDPAPPPRPLLDLDGVVAAHLAHGSPAQGPGSWHAAGPADAVRDFDTVFLVETLDRPRAQRVLDVLRTRLDLHDVRDFGADVYDLAFVFPGHRADAREGHRRAHWSGEP